MSGRRTRTTPAPPADATERARRGGSGRGAPAVALVARVRDFFLASPDWNGIPARDLAAELGATWPQLRARLVRHLRAGRVTVAFASTSGNPHIKRLPDPPVEDQVATLLAAPVDDVCVYPTAAVVASAVDLAAYDDRPFARRLLLAEAHLTPVWFELEVLDRYARDPRFRLDFRDYVGKVVSADEHYTSDAVPERHKVLLQTFGIGYDPRRTRVVVVYLRYLAGLPPEHQQLWRAHALGDADGPFTINGDYERATLWGAWPRYRSAYAAFLQERAEVNALAERIGRPPLFRQAFDERRPPGFGPMLRPTRRNLQEFAHLLDKLLSESIDPKFFAGEVEPETRTTRPDGSVQVERRGTLQLLEAWLAAHYTPMDGTDLGRDVFGPLREVRKLRQRPAHAIEADDYDPKYAREQDALLARALRALTCLRLILSSHPLAAGYAPPDWLDGDRIVFY